MNNELNKTKINHITWECHINSIQSDKVIKLEGSNLEKVIRNGNHIGKPNQIYHSNLWRIMKKQFKKTGRYVWFTEEDDVECIGNEDEMNFKKVVIPFYAEDIGAKKWSVIKKTIKDKQGKKIIKGLEEVAKEMGDDISKWWVCKKPVPINNLDNCSS